MRLNVGGSHDLIVFGFSRSVKYQLHHVPVGSTVLFFLKRDLYVVCLTVMMPFLHIGSSCTHPYRLSV